MNHLSLRLITTPAKLKEAVLRILQLGKPVYIDTEIADWMTPHPRLSLLQVLIDQNEVVVVDALSEQMKTAIEQMFISAVMENPEIAKWAHNASFDQRFLGSDKVRNLCCTLRLARSVPYHLLPVDRLSLDELAKHLLDIQIDKSLQKADWGSRPLTDVQLRYAAMDPVWCSRVHARLEELREEARKQETMRPPEIHEAYCAILLELAGIQDRIESIRTAVKNHMVDNGIARFSNFSLHFRLKKMIPLSVLCGLANHLDPGRTMDFSALLSRKLLDQLAPGTLETLRERQLLQESMRTTFRGPVAPPKRRKPIYVLDTMDQDKVTDDYRSLTRKRKILESKKDQLRFLMRRYMESQEIRTYMDWVIPDAVPAWRVDVRYLAEFIPVSSQPELNLPKKFELAFSPEEIESAASDIQSTEVPVLIWREFRPDSPSELRDWEAEESTADLSAEGGD